MKFDAALENIADNIKSYRQLKIQYHSGEKLNDILKQISATLYYLETERSKAHDTFQKRIGELVLSGMTVSRAENQAHIDVPEMYQLRRIMDAAYLVTDAIRSNLSWLKNEKNSA